MWEECFLKVLMIIPAYNEENSIVRTVSSLKKAKIKNGTLDYIIVNDGSTDKTKEICEKENLNYIDLPMNLGIGGAVQTGYKYAYENNYDIAIQFDGDGQHDASYINNLVIEIEKGNNVAIGSRYVADLSEFRSTALRRFGSSFLSFLIKLCTGRKIYDPTSGFRAADKEVIALFASDYPTDYPEPDTIVTVIKGGYKVSEIPVKMNERISGKSSLSSPFKAAFYMIKVSVAIIVSGLSHKRREK